jgi:hypothetical protein
MQYIPKTLYLPSGGLLYPPVAYIHKLDASYYLAELDANIYDTNFDKIQSIIKRFCLLPIDINNMLLSDIYYIYSYILTTDIVEDIYLLKTAYCSSCDTFNKVSVSAANFNIQVYNPYDPICFNNEYVTLHNTKIKIRHRIVQDNLQYVALISLEENEYDELHIIKMMVYFVMTQIEEIIYNNKLVHKKHWKEVLENLVTRDLFQLFNQTLEFNKTIGIYDKFKFVCKNCGAKNYFWFFDDIIDNKVITQRTINREQLLIIIKSFISESRLPCFTLSDVMNRPLHYQEIYKEAIDSLDFKIGQVMV